MDIFLVDKIIVLFFKCPCLSMKTAWPKISRTTKIQIYKMFHILINLFIFALKQATYIIFSGNLAFLNHLTMIPAICAFDDKFFAPVFCSCDKIKAIISEKTVKTGRIRKSINFCISCLILKLSYPVVINLLSRKQV